MIRIVGSQNPRQVILYTDGGDIHGNIGAAAWNPRQQWGEMVKIGPS